MRTREWNWLSAMEGQGSVGVAMWDAGTRRLGGGRVYGASLAEVVRWFAPHIREPGGVIFSSGDMTVAHAAEVAGLQPVRIPTDRNHFDELDALLSRTQLPPPWKSGTLSLGCVFELEHVAVAQSLVALLEQLRQIQASHSGDSSIQAPRLAVQTVERLSAPGQLQVDELTLLALHVLPVASQPHHTSVFGQCGRFLCTRVGRRQLRDWLATPLTEERTLKHRLDDVDAFARFSDATRKAMAATRALPAVRDVSHSVERILDARSTQSDWLQLRRVLDAAHLVVQLLSAEGHSKSQPTTSWGETDAVRPCELDGLVRVPEYEAFRMTLMRTIQDREKPGPDALSPILVAYNSCAAFKNSCKRTKRSSSNPDPIRLHARESESILEVEEEEEEEEQNENSFKSYKELRKEDVETIVAEWIGKQARVADSGRPLLQDGCDAELDRQRARYHRVANSLVQEALRAQVPKVAHLPGLGYVVIVDEQGMTQSSEPLGEILCAQGWHFCKTARMRELDRDREHFGDVWTDVATREDELVYALRQQLQPLVRRIRAVVLALGRVDAVRGVAEWSRQEGCTRPQWTTDGSLDIELATHPVLLALPLKKAEECSPTEDDSSDDEHTQLAEGRKNTGKRKKEEYRAGGIRHSLQMGGRFPRTAILTGPHGGGKSSCLRIVGTFAIMAQAGLPLPARRARLPLFTAVHTRIRSAEGLTTHRSSFLADLQQVGRMLAAARAQPSAPMLMLVDEFGKGTLEADGVTLLAALVRLVAAPDCDWPLSLAMFSTHYADALFGHSESNGGLLDWLRPHLTLLQARNYHLTPGVSDDSQLLQASIEAGLPNEFVDRLRIALKEVRSKRFISPVQDPSEPHFELKAALVKSLLEWAGSSPAPSTWPTFLPKYLG